MFSVCLKCHRGCIPVSRVAVYPQLRMFYVYLACTVFVMMCEPANTSHQLTDVVSTAMSNMRPHAVIPAL